MNSNTIDLNQKKQITSSSLINNEQHGYQPKTLQQNDHRRYAYLPTFPTESIRLNDSLLLANVPVTRLEPHEINRRQQGVYISNVLMSTEKYDSSNGFTFSEQDTEELATRLHIHKSIITFNVNQLRRICFFLLTLYESFRRTVLCKKDIALKEPILDSKQMALLLEFYLQIDVDLFYMKTCSFRGAEPRSKSEGLFCGNDEPQARYTFRPCGDLFCLCCHPIHNYNKIQTWPVIDFASSSMHQFLNRYTTYLNCPVTCTTSNLIYGMTCPCGHYDYVDSTAETLTDALACKDHREHGNRIIHEKLTGSPLFRGSIMDPNGKQNEIANRMRLYQHSARCSVVLRSFLDCNPIYWCFIPVLWNEALAENSIHTRGTSDTDLLLLQVLTSTAVGNRRLANYLNCVPLPPAAYVFSNQQLPYFTLDLYKVAIIAVLPDKRSIILRYIIETLFIIHAETKLNMICPIGIDVEKRYGRVYDLVWCANLKQPPMSTTTKSIQ
ncbi:unnamed protein product [Rotaria magnacalcarata]|uniref:Uncharacterized protein n=1 Tax=Rotaria magnacalcarata TaxID=392030 RepID=A0A8S2MCS7_9BILA|nr:unnamed protein product [Rotaria magnacalcarata]CAF3810074.1 unnamed protein product [Rotaria magnacalcarata]CAF3934882.1 unnamed protein product [Rotaria magnacalcarata]